MTNNSKHTPGPWLVSAEESKSGTIVWDGRENVCLVFHDGAYLSPGDDRTSEDEGIANARLIAATPNMYDYIKSKAVAGDKEAIKIISALD